jgi:hypothetical protein
MSSISSMDFDPGPLGARRERSRPAAQYGWTLD